MCSGLLSLLSRLIAFCPVLTICQPQWLLSSHIVFPFLTHQVRSLLRFLCTSGLYPHFFALLTPTQLSHCSSYSFFRKAFFDFPQLNEFQMLFYNVFFSFITTIPVFNYIFTWSSVFWGRLWVPWGQEPFLSTQHSVPAPNNAWHKSSEIWLSMQE